jgi:hypothetical protein
MPFYPRTKRSGRSFLNVLSGGLLFVVATAHTLGAGEPQLSERIRRGGNPHEGAISMSFRESDVRKLDDTAKTAAAREGVQLAAAIMSTRDPAIDVKRYPGRAPPFDYAKYGIAPFLNVVEPSLIKDPAVRAAYSEALEKHEKLLMLWGKEGRKQQEADYCMGCVRDIIAGATQKEVVAKAAMDSIAALQDADWIKDYLRATLLPPPKEQIAPVAPPSPARPAPAGVPTLAVAPPLPAMPVARVEPPAKGVSPVADNPVPAVPTSGHGNRWMLIGLIAACLGIAGIVWAFYKRRRPRKEPGK